MFFKNSTKSTVQDLNFKSTPFRSTTFIAPLAPKKPSFLSKYKFSPTPTERKVMQVVLVFIFGIAVWFGVSAFLAWILMLLVNYVMPTLSHPEIHLTFWPAFAIMVICGLLFKGGGSSSK